MKRILFSLALSGFFGLTSCQKDTDVKPIILQSSHAGTRTASPSGVIASPAKRLHSEGSATFSYNAEGQLKLYDTGAFKAEFMYLSASQADFYPGYKPAKGIRMQGIYNGAPTQWTLYYLLDANGVCQRAVLSTPTGKRYYNYSYNSSKQLLSLSEPTANKFWNFEYNAQGQLNRMRVFDCGVVVEETQVGYKFPDGSYLPNRLGHYANVSSVPNFLYFRYLPVFGKPGDQLVRRQVITETATGKTISDYQYAYSLDFDGYINTVMNTNMLTNYSSLPIPYTYEAVDNQEAQ